MIRRSVALLAWLEPISWQGGTPSVHPSDVTPQAVPR
jgi:hypothetical protein